MKIYTKSGDQGTTGLIGGKRVLKSSPRIAAYGEVDELNAMIGLAAAETAHGPIKSSLTDVQTTLFILGANLASPTQDSKIERITAAHAETLERQIDAMSETLPPLTHFILPGGSRVAAVCHLARTICRRAERSVVHLVSDEGEPVDKWITIYLNRLSDYLFVLARVANQLEKVADILWIPEKKP